ncbi:MAG TPA: hypothetical protein VM557_09125 [Thermoanaerobaculia bacterium]|nr:hypothetical protein [Thermoanaerobaculia bacterium]
MRRARNGACVGLALLFLCALPVRSDQVGVPERRIAEIGRGTAIVFTPDLAAPGNRLFYESLGFLYIEECEWERVVAALESHEVKHPHQPIEAVILETHGTNGHGLKLQNSKDPEAPRSYISIGALAERLDRLAIDRAYVSACNAGRLFRPRIFRALDPKPGDPLFLPPTLGIINASEEFDPARSRVEIFRRGSSHLETLLHGFIRELGSETRRRIQTPDETTFAVSTMLIPLLTEDPKLELTSNGWVEARSRHDFSAAEGEALFQTLVAWLEERAREQGSDDPADHRSR